MKSSTRIPAILRRVALAAALAFSVLAAGCPSMSDPDKSDLPWSQHNSWEDAPNIPPSMLNNR